jgi:hypothetical protein
MQDVIQMGMDEELLSEFEGASAGAKIKLTVMATISEIDDERLSATIDSIDEGVEIMSDEEEFEPEMGMEEEEPEAYEEDEDEEEELA